MSWENRDSSQPTPADGGKARLRPIGATLEAQANVALIQGILAEPGYSACWLSMTTAMQPTAWPCW